MMLWKLRVVRPATADLRRLALLFMALDQSRFKSGIKPRRRHALLNLHTKSENKDVVNETGHTSMWPLLSMAVPSRKNFRSVWCAAAVLMIERTQPTR
jgi:hypothetical protein